MDWKEPDPSGRPGQAREEPLAERISFEELSGFSGPEVAVAAEKPGLSRTDELYSRAADYVLDSIRGAESGRTPDVDRARLLLIQILESMNGGPELLLLATRRDQPFSVTWHSVNVAVLAIRVSRALGYSPDRQSQVGLAGLLHEIGVVRLPREALQKEGDPDPAALQRPVYSARILGRLGEAYQWLAQTAAQVYEREDGSGHPRGLEGRQIREEAKILGIADVFEACIHERPYRRALTGYQLLHELTTQASRGFSDRIVKALLQSFSLFPYNEYVVLNTGEIAVVIQVNSGNLMRPEVRVLFGCDGEPLKEPRRVNLLQKPSLSITRAIAHDRIPSFG